MKNNVMLPAFTITEALISLVITSIIISFVFVIFSITSQRIINFRKQNERVADINRFSYSINKSIFENENIQYIEGELLFKHFTGEITKYILYNEYCVRYNKDYTDTFHFPVNKVIIDTLRGKSSKVYYQRLRFDIESDKQIHKFLFYKKLFANQIVAYEY